MAQDTKDRIIEATLTTLKREGFAGSSAREIAKTGGFNQALIFYHFGTLKDLLLAALDRTSDERMARYRALLDQASSLSDLVDVSSAIFREDIDSGHIKVLAELISGASSLPELGPAIAGRIQPWIEFTERTIRRVLSGSPLSKLVPAGDLAYAINAMYLGLEMHVHLDGDRTRADRLFDLGGGALKKLDRVLRPLQRRAR